MRGVITALARGRAGPAGGAVPIHRVHDGGTIESYGTNKVNGNHNNADVVGTLAPINMK
jgi:hypothetical protein